MGECFHGWRRKIGVVTLVMACVIMMSLVRHRTLDYADGWLDWNSDDSYLRAIIPLTLLSAWLLLSKPRVAKPKPPESTE